MHSYYATVVSTQSVVVVELKASLVTCLEWCWTIILCLPSGNLCTHYMTFFYIMWTFVLYNFKLVGLSRNGGVGEIAHWMLQVILFFYTEINRVRNELFHGVVKNAEVDGMFTELQLPTPSGPRVKLSEKVYAPVKEYPKVRLPVILRGRAIHFFGCE